MKLKSGIVMEKTGDEYIVVATGEAAKSFNGIIRNNKTANFVFEQLKDCLLYTSPSPRDS